MKKSKIALWVLTVFMFLAAVVYMPSVASVLMLAFAAIALPVQRVQEFWRSIRITGPIKAVLLAVIFCVSISLAPRDKAVTEDDPPPDTASVSDNEPDNESPQSDGEASEPQEPESGRYTLPCGMELQLSDTVRNDTTGRWRLSTTSSSLAPADYAVEYYKEVFSSDNEVHAIWNETLKTTTRITAAVGLLFVDTFEYVDGEENDANALFSGALLDNRIIDSETGEPYEDPNAVSTSIDPESIDNKANDIINSIESRPAGGGNGSNFNTYNNPGQQQTSSNFVLNTKTMKFHSPSCDDVAKIAPENYSTSSASKDSLMSQGYSPCGHCSP